MPNDIYFVNMDESTDIRFSIEETTEGINHATLTTTTTSTTTTMTTTTRTTTTTTISTEKLFVVYGVAILFILFAMGFYCRKIRNRSALKIM